MAMLCARPQHFAQRYGQAGRDLVSRHFGIRKWLRRYLIPSFFISIGVFPFYYAL